RSVDAPVLRSGRLEHKDVMTIVVRRESLCVLRREIDVRLDTLVKERFKVPTQERQGPPFALQRLKDDSSACMVLGEYRVGVHHAIDSSVSPWQRSCVGVYGKRSTISNEAKV